MTLKVTLKMYVHNLVYSVYLLNIYISIEPADCKVHYFKENTSFFITIAQYGCKLLRSFLGSSKYSQTGLF